MPIFIYIYIYIYMCVCVCAYVRECMCSYNFGQILTGGHGHGPKLTTSKQ